MKKTLLVSRFALVSLTLLAFAGSSCRKNGSPSNGAAGQHSVQVFLTDDPSFSFDHLFIDIRKLEVKAEDSVEDRGEREDRNGSDDRDRQGDNSGGWVTLDIHPGVYDILKFRNGLDTLFGSGTFTGARAVRKLRLTLGDSNSAVAGGATIPLSLSGNDRTVVIRFSDDLFDDRPDAVSFSIDFDGAGSIKQHGNRFELHPQVRAFRKERSAGIEGKVLPLQAQAMVMAISSSDTATAKPGAEGEFKIDGLKPGTYRIVVHATAGAFVDATLNNIVLGGKEDVRVGTITLHP